MGVGGGVQRIEMTERETPVFGGAEFGAVGTYERLHGTVFGELDPTHRLNVGIVNLDRAARNANGNVEYQSEFRILKPLAGAITLLSSPRRSPRRLPMPTRPSISRPSYPAIRSMTFISTVPIT